MLHDFLTLNRNEVINRCWGKAALRGPLATAGLEHGVPLFLEQLVATLRIEQKTAIGNVEETAPESTSTKIGRAATLHGAELLRSGYSIDQVVRVYGDVCQVITGLAVEQEAPIGTDEFRTLSRCLDIAVAAAVAAFAHGPDERCRLIDVAIHSFAALENGNRRLDGATAKIHATALVELRDLIESPRASQSKNDA